MISLNFNLILMEAAKPESSTHLNEPIKIEDTTLAHINPLPAQPSHKECRICLSADDPSDMISPCDCIGSMKYVHERCLKEWLQMRIFKQSEEENPQTQNQNSCELCKKEIAIQMKTKRQCRSKREIRTRINNRLKLFVICLIGMIVALGVIVYASIELANQVKLGYGRVQPISKGVVLGALPVTFLLECYFIYNFTWYFLKSTFKVKIVSKKE